MEFEEKVKRVLRESLDGLDDETRQKIAARPGTTMQRVGDTAEFSAAGILYAAVDWDWLTDDELGFEDATVHMIPRAETLPDSLEGIDWEENPDPEA
ncbi:hypothetical protein [Rhodococcus sp. SORGH_AS_0303]|uniref:hypothetical protein n=1 Tax=Rhodococcus sp. SORGH_AS_0303 TaxID=3041753 RepID=UPI002785F119|nr:hypothetical protein [Rhodococcus sp. SORGH_AS_0303]MDQ1202720.1 hypothetical protein [Rhodococcus sp. SORGH_AS_0303]